MGVTHLLLALLSLVLGHADSSDQAHADAFSTTINNLYLGSAVRTLTLANPSKMEIGAAELYRQFCRPGLKIKVSQSVQEDVSWTHGDMTRKSVEEYVGIVEELGVSPLNYIRPLAYRKKALDLGMMFYRGCPKTPKAVLVCRAICEKIGGIRKREAEISKSIAAFIEKLDNHTKKAGALDADFVASLGRDKFAGEIAWLICFGIVDPTGYATTEFGAFEAEYSCAQAALSSFGFYDKAGLEKASPGKLAKVEENSKLLAKGSANSSQAGGEKKDSPSAEGQKTAGGEPLLVTSQQDVPRKGHEDQQPKWPSSEGGDVSADEEPSRHAQSEGGDAAADEEPSLPAHAPFAATQQEARSAKNLCPQKTIGAFIASLDVLIWPIAILISILVSVLVIRRK